MPYKDLPPTAFWSECRASPDFAIERLYQPKFTISRTDRIATIGSCFAQHIARRLKAAGAHFLDMEPPPHGLPRAEAARFGFGLFSARYGNVYSPKQLRQLARDSRWRRVDRSAIWRRGDRYFDALRPGVEPDGLPNAKTVALHRYDHLHRVGRLFRQCDVIVITLGLTEYWADRRTGRAFATCPGVVAGTFDPARHVMRNATYREARADLAAAIRTMRRRNRSLRVILTVSPVPLTATATGAHVLAANTYSKSTLRAVAGDIANGDPLTDYFPSYEMAAMRPDGRTMFEPDLRQVSARGIDLIMARFFAAHPDLGAERTANAEESAAERRTFAETDTDVDLEVCEDLLLDAMRKQ